MISAMLKKNKKQREFCILNWYREVFQNANGSLSKKSKGDFIFFVLHFHIFLNEHVILRKKEK